VGTRGPLTRPPPVDLDAIRTLPPIPLDLNLCVDLASKPQPDVPPLSVPRRPRRRDDRVAALCFLLPSLLGLVIFMLLPLLASLALSFTGSSMFGQTTFVGFRNYVQLLTIDPSFWGVLGNTVIYTIEYLVLNVVLSLTMAVWIANLRWGKQFFRILFFLPTFTPLVGSAIVWLLIFTPGGLLDWVTQSLGFDPPNLITNPDLAIQAIVIVSLWSGFGYNLLLFSAALDSVPTSYLDAAVIDGATAWQRFWSIKMPLISPALFFGTVMTMINSLQVFDQVYALTRGGPGSSIMTLGYYIYDSGFQRYHMGYASAIAWLLFLIIMGLTILQLRLQKKWVRYDV
jgi:multiple sugar transport system permease protein